MKYYYCPVLQIMLHPLPPQLLKFVQFRNHSQQVVCEAAYFGWEGGFYTVDTHICSVPSSACAREQSHTQLMNRGRAKTVPAFPVFLLPSGMNGGKATVPLANPAEPRAPPPRWCVLTCSACSLVPAQAVHVGREPCAPVPGPAPNQYVLASKPTPHAGTDDSSKSSEIFNSSVPRDFPAPGAEGTEC